MKNLQSRGKTAKRFMSAALTAFMAMSSAGSVTAVNFANVSAKTTVKKSTKKAMKTKKKKKKTPKVYITPTSKTIYTKSSTYVYLKNNKGTVKWSASNTKVTLSKKTKGSVKVYGKSAGTSYVTAKVGKKKYTCKVTVKNKSNNNASLSTSSKTLYPGDCFTLKFNGGSVTKWSASNSKVLLDEKTKKSVFVTATQKTGTAVITATVGKKKYTCTITVKKRGDSAKQNDSKSDTSKTDKTDKKDSSAFLTRTNISMTMDIDQAHLKYLPYDTDMYDDESRTAKINDHYISLITPDDSNVKWSTSNANVASITNQGSIAYEKDRSKTQNFIEFKPNDFGTATITAAYRNKTYTCAISITPSAYYYEGMRIVNSVTNSSMDDATKAAKLAIFVAKHMTYGAGNAHGSNLVGFFEGKGYCSDFAVGYSYLLSLANITSRIVSLPDEDHAYNQIYLKNGWVNADTTALDSDVPPNEAEYESSIMKYTNIFISDNRWVELGLFSLDSRESTYTANNTDYDYITALDWYKK